MLPAVMVLKALLVDPAPVVRAASVYALGIFINRRSERTEHANTLDQNIATRLLYKILLVMKELLVTIQYMINSFPKNSMSLMRAIAIGISSTMLGKAGSMTRVSSEDKLSRQMMKERRSVIVAPQSLSGSVTAEQDGRLQ